MSVRTSPTRSLHNTGVAWRDGKFADPGAGQGNFKTPTLREIARTAPYMHDGSLATLEDVIEYYDRGGNRNPGLDPEIRRPASLPRREAEHHRDKWYRAPFVPIPLIFEFHNPHSVRLFGFGL